jgi:hypothetical protein
MEWIHWIVYNFTLQKQAFIEAVKRQDFMSLYDSHEVNHMHASRYYANIKHAKITSLPKGA